MCILWTNKIHYFTLFYIDHKSNYQIFKFMPTYTMKFTAQKVILKSTLSGVALTCDCFSIKGVEFTCMATYIDSL